MKFPVYVEVLHPGVKPAMHYCTTQAEFESLMSRARNSTATKIQVFELSYSLSLQTEWVKTPATTTQE